jgi:hypothetical protein
VTCKNCLRVLAREDAKQGVVTNFKTGEVTKFHPITPRSRLEEVVAELNGYRQGWITYDPDHVRELQRERVALHGGDL